MVSNFLQLYQVWIWWSTRHGEYFSSTVPSLDLVEHLGCSTNLLNLGQIHRFNGSDPPWGLWNRNRLAKKIRSGSGFDEFGAGEALNQIGPKETRKLAVLC